MPSVKRGACLNALLPEDITLAPLLQTTRKFLRNCRFICTTFNKILKTNFIISIIESFEDLPEREGNFKHGRYYMVI